MKLAISYVEDPTCPHTNRVGVGACRSGMRNSQCSRTTNILIINQRPSIETTSDRDKAMTCQGMCQPFVVSLDAGTINRTQTQHGSQWLTVGASRIQDNLFGSKFRLGVKSVRLSR